MHFEINNSDPRSDTPSEVPGKTEIHFPINPKTEDQDSNVESKNFQIPLAKNNLNFSEATHFHRGPRGRAKGYQLVAWSLVAAVIDGLLILGVGIFFILGASLFTAIHLQDIINLTLELPYLPLALGGGLIFFYMSIQRVLMGHSIGEWACGLRLGQAKQRLGRYYGLQVCLRSILNIVSGLVFFPLLSSLVGRDVLGWILNLPLIQLDPELR